MNKNIIIALMLIISNINANESTLDSSFNEDIIKKDDMLSDNYNIQQVKQMNYNIFKLNWNIQNFVTESLRNNNDTIADDLQDLSINSITFSLSIYSENLYNIPMCINNIKTTLSNLSQNSNLNNKELEQINKDFLNICNILHNK